MKLRVAQLVLCLSVFASCSDHSFKEGKFYAGGKYASAKTLNKGKMLYTEYCMACHGVSGDGKGVSAKGLVPPPRDFTLGIYKFGHVASGDLPSDDDFKFIIKNGLNGTGMLAWDMSDEQMDAVIQYIKSFAPTAWEGKDKVVGVPIVAGIDPFGESHKNAAIERGKEVFHIVAQCQSCHRAYVSKEELSAMNKKLNGKPLTEFDEKMYEVKLQDSQYNVKTLPPDFTWHSVRSAKTVEEFYVRIASGVGGTAMPGWKDTLSHEDLWAVAHYVNYLTTLKDTSARDELFGKLK